MIFSTEDVIGVYIDTPSIDGTKMNEKINNLQTNLLYPLSWAFCWIGHRYRLP